MQLEPLTEPLGEIKTRAEAINLSLKKLARLAGLAPSTAYRMVESGSCLRRTELRLRRQLDTEERRVLRHLLGIHGAAVRPDNTVQEEAA